MKKKLIGIAVASFGMILSVGSAIALYVKAADPASFGIGQGTYEGSEGAITYKINGNTTGTVAPAYLKANGENGGAGLGGEYTQVKYEFALSATYSSTFPREQHTSAECGNRERSCAYRAPSSFRPSGLPGRYVRR